MRIGIPRESRPGETLVAATATTSATPAARPAAAVSASPTYTG